MKQVYFQNGYFFIIDDNNKIIRLNLAGFGGGGPGRRGPAGPAGPAGPSNVLANALFVDAIHGLDANAAPSTFMDAATNPATHKYQTITAALADAQAGDVIIVYPGSYIESTNLWLDGLTYYMYPGAIVTGNFLNAAAGQSCEVYGNGTFFATDAANGIVSLGDGSMYLQAEDLLNPILNGTILIFGAAGANALNPQLKVECRNITTNSSGIRMRATGTSAYLSVNFNTIEHVTVSQSNELIDVNGPGGETCFQGVADIKGNRILGSPNYPAAGGSIIELNNANEGGMKAVINIEADIYDRHAGLAATRTLITCEFCENTEINIKGNVYGVAAERVTNQRAIRVLDSPSGNTDFNFTGNINTTKEILITANAFGTANHQNINLTGEFESSIATEAMSINAAGTQVPRVRLNGALYNTSVAGVGINKVLAASVLIFDNFKIVTGGGASITSGVGDTYKVIHSLASNIAQVNAANSIVGSIDYVDAGVE